MRLKSKLGNARRAAGTWLTGVLTLIIVLIPALRKRLFFTPAPAEACDEFNNFGVDL